MQGAHGVSLKLAHFAPTIVHAAASRNFHKLIPTHRWATTWDYVMQLPWHWRTLQMALTCLTTVSNLVCQALASSSRKAACLLFVLTVSMSNRNGTCDTDPQE